MAEYPCGEDLQLIEKWSFNTADYVKGFLNIDK